MSERPVVAVDDGIPLKDSMAARFDIRTAPPAGFTTDHLGDCDALLVRAKTRVTRALLQGSAIQYVGSATSGTDHLDLKYLRRHNITTVHAPGSNATAVAEYVLGNALTTFSSRDHDSLSLGIVGFGNVGQAVYQRARHLGWRCVVNDPPRAEQHDKPAPPEGYASLTEALSQDIVTLHVPFVRSGTYATAGMLGEPELRLMKQGAVLINAARGGIVNEDALCDEIDAGRLIAIVDCWLGEPLVNDRLLKLAQVATPHIAGHTVEAKERAAAWLVRSMSERFACHQDRVDEAPNLVQAGPPLSTFASELTQWYDYAPLSLEFRDGSGQAANRKREQFASLRAKAGARREIPAYANLGRV